MVAVRRTGFTLVEILVVIAIIAILAGLLFPVFTQVMEKGRQASCMSNLRQIGMAMRMYSQDYSGYWPMHPAWVRPGPCDICKPLVCCTCVPDWATTTTMNWPASILNYAKNTQIFVCPSSQMYPGENAAKPLISYLYNGFAAGRLFYYRPPIYSPRKVEDTADPANKVLVWDTHILASWSRTNPGWTWGCWGEAFAPPPHLRHEHVIPTSPPKPQVPGWFETQPTRGYLGWHNMLYQDGHVKPMRTEEVKSNLQKIPRSPNVFSY